MPITTIVQSLEIVRGIGPYAVDTTSAEQPMEVLSLLNPQGFAVQESGWIPNFPQVKDGGLYAESPVSDGRILIAASEDNVTETMQLVASSATFATRYILERQLHAFAERARDFHTEQNQIEPVYLKAWFQGAPGPQYALIFNIQVAQRKDPFAPYNVNELTVTIEREPFWRPIPPGANPKLWTIFFRNSTLTTDPDDLYIGARDLTYSNAVKNLFQTNGLENSREWNVGQSDVTSENYIDIPAADIPGDAPALVCLAVEIPSVTAGGLYVGRQTKSTTLVGRNGTNNTSVLVLNAGDVASRGSDATIQADTGAPNSNNQSSGQRGRVAFVTASLVQRFRWRAQGVDSPETRIDTTLERGTYAAFLRARLSAAGTVQLQLQYGLNDLTNLVLNPIFNLTEVGAGGTGNTTLWGVAYLGTISIPLTSARVSVGADGKGVLVLPSNTSFSSLSIVLAAARTSGTPELYVADLVLIPIDECSIGLKPTSAGFLGAVNTLIYDNTGYFQHGYPGDYAMYWRYFSAGGETPAEDEVAEIQGGQLMLLPGVNNRLHFLYADVAQSIVKQTGNRVYLNAVPRWRGIRDV